MMIIWMVIPLTLIVLLCLYIYIIVRRGIHYFKKTLSDKKLKMISIITTIILMLPTINIFGIWTLILLHAAIFTLIVDIVKIIYIKIVHKPVKIFIKRIYYSEVAVIAAVVVLMGYGYWNMSNIIRTEYTVTTDKSIRNDGYKVALIADLHYGLSLDKDELNEQIKRISNENPDMVLLDGDIVDEDTTLEGMQEVFKILGSIKSNYGIYYVYGNHDKSNYRTNPQYTKEQLEKSITDSGITILEDDVTTINDDITLVGRMDLGEKDKRNDINELTKDVDKDSFILVMDHQPCQYEQEKESGTNLCVSGHTHAGQIFPTGIFAEKTRINDMNYGMRMDGSFNAIVTSGIAGWGFPVRTEGHSEYVIINIINN